MLRRRCVLLLFTVLSPAFVLAMSGSPFELPCGAASAIGGAWERIQCDFSGEPYVPPDVGWSYPVSYVYPTPLPNKRTLKLKVFLHGYSGTPTHCESDFGATAGFFVINHCAAHYPNHNAHAVSGNLPMGWWGAFGGTNSNGYRIALSITRAMNQFWRSIDTQAGIRLEGSSYGGTGSILQSMMLPDAFWRQYVSVVHANVPHTLFVNSHYHRDPAVSLAWQSYDTQRANFYWNAAMGRVDHIYYRINGATNDDLGLVELDFFRLCDAHRIACFGTWHKGGHATNEQGVRLPTRLFAGENQTVRLNQVLPVFSHSTANHWGERGHYNLGLSWHSDQIEDSVERLTVPLRYRQHTDMGADIPDQPDTVRFDLTLRRTQSFALREGETLYWRLGDQGGVAEVQEQGSLSLLGLSLPSAEGYTLLTVSRDAF